MRYITRQIIDLVPKIYDTRRIARIIGVDGEVDQAIIDPSQQQAVTKVVNEQGIVIQKIYNPSVGKYDVRVTTGPSYMTKRQESMDAMGQILQGNPQLWMAAGDLFVKNMDWPGAQELAARLKKMIDPKLLQDEDDPTIQAANQQIEALNAQLQQMMGLLQNVNQSMEAQDLAIKRQANDIKAYEAETRRVQALAQAMTPEQVQEMVVQTLRDVMNLGNLAAVEQQLVSEQGMPQ